MGNNIFIATPVDYGNYGNRLQNFAVHRICEQLGLKPETLAVENKRYFKIIPKHTIIKILSKLHFDRLIVNRPKFNSVLKSIYFWRFTHQLINTKYVSKHFNPSTISDSDFVGIGGDQIWSKYWHDVIPFCNFEGFNPDRKICFAPSFGTDKLEPDYERQIQNELKSIEWLAVREKSGADIIYRLIDHPAKVISDPVINISRDEWISYINSVDVSLPSNKYMFLYFLGNVSENKKKWIINQAEAHDLCIIDLNGNVTGNAWITSPLGFLKMLSDSECVLTDSFHAILFSLLFEKKLIVFLRDGGEKMNTRINNLIDSFNLGNACFSIDKDISQFVYDFVEVTRQIDASRKESLEFYFQIIGKDSSDYVFPYCYKAYNKNDIIRSSSSSGGIYYQLGSKIISLNGIVVGAQTDNDGIVSLELLENEIQLKNSLGSKYVQADVNNIYRKVEALLNKDVKVLFSGTPCQCNALYSYLGKEYDNLIIVDFICHGVPSQGIWKKYLALIKNGRKIKNIKFRDKRDSWKNYGLSISFDDNSEYYCSKNKDSYLQLFLNNITLRKSCYNCRSKGSNRCSDITLADFWGCKDSELGVSACIVNSKKGKELLNSISDDIYIERSSLNEIIKYNPSYYNSVGCPFSRNRFFIDYMKDLLVFESINSYTRVTVFEKAIRFILRKLKNKGIIRNKKNKTKYISILRKGYDVETYKFTCSGCSACANICPKNAIVMKSDNEGFKYPSVQYDMCIDCKKCEKVCFNTKA